MDSQPVFSYFDGRGLGEIVRITFCLGGVKFGEKNVKTREEFLTKCDDHTFLFRCVPYMKWGSLELCQSPAIVRYIARKTGMMGKDDEETARIDMMYEASRDFYRNFLMFGFRERDPIVKELEDKVLPKFLPIFNRILESNGSGYVVGSGPTLADAGLLECLLAVTEVFSEEVFKEFSGIKTFMTTMKGLPNIDNYIKNVRYPPNGPEYVNAVGTILGK